MRRMSFAITTDQILNRTKTVTRRVGWNHLKIGERLLAVDKLRTRSAQKLAVIEVVSIRKERVLDIRTDDCRREGMGRGECWCKRKSCDQAGGPWCFINMFCDAMGVAPDATVNRIEFKYVDECGYGSDEGEAVWP